MPNFIIRIFDFDKTLTVAHSFSKTCLDRAGITDTKAFHESQYASGKSITFKSGLDDYLRHDNTHITSIATYHNNHSVIAGALAAYFQSELHHEGTTTMPDGLSAIAKYRMEGADHPIYISYIPATGALYLENIKELVNKNNQLSTLRPVLERQLNTLPGIRIDFYDDTSGNAYPAVGAKQVRTYYVEAQNTVFSVIVINPLLKSYPSDRSSGPSLRCSSEHSNPSLGSQEEFASSSPPLEGSPIRSSPAG